MKNMRFEEVLVAELHTAPYNRPINNVIAKKWSKKFSMKLVNAIIVSNRDGVNYIVDGQHRSAAARIKGIRTLPAVVHYGLSYEEEAELFVELNKERRGLLVSEVFRGEVEAGNPRAIDLKSAIHAADYEIGKGQGRRKVQALQVLQKIYSADGPEMVTQVLQVLGDAYDGSSEANGRLMILGVWRFVSVYKGMFSRDRLVKRLALTPPSDIIRDAKNKLYDGKSDATRAGIIIRNVYNKGLSVKLPDKFQ